MSRISALRPRPGRELAPELRPDRVGELAQALAGGVRDPGMIDLLARIDDEEGLNRGDRIRIFTDGTEAFRSMGEAIRAARQEVLLESYIFRDDRSGQTLFEHLRRAAGRGVRVRVLADGWGSFGTRNRFWRRLQGAGVEVRLFHPILRQPWYHPWRDHRKILVVDRRVGFTGGMNVGDEYSPPDPAERPAWRDTHCRLEGPTAREMALVFAEGWEQAGGEPFEVDLEPADRGEDRDGERPRGTGHAHTLVLESRPGRGHAESASVLAALVAAARRSVWITNSYFAPRARAVELLGRVAGRGVDVRLLLPGVTDVAVARHAGHAWYRRLLDSGVRIWEYQPSVLHAKSLVVDGHASVVGSTNLDFRSFRLNAECNLVILGDATGQRLEEEFERDLRRSREITAELWERRSLAHRIGDRLAWLLTPLL